MSEVGGKIPPFRGMTEDGPLTAKDLKGAAAVIYFYPKDDTPGCTKEAFGLRRHFSPF